MQALEQGISTAEAVKQFEEQRITAVHQRKEKLITLGEAAFSYFEEAARFQGDKKINFGDLGRERDEVRKLNQRIAELELVLRHLRPLAKTVAG